MTKIIINYNNTKKTYFTPLVEELQNNNNINKRMIVAVDVVVAILNKKLILNFRILLRASP